MTTAIQTTKPAEAFRLVAADRLKAAADMTLYELVDEFQRLSVVVENSAIERAEDDYSEPRLTPEGELAQREIGIVNGAAKSRFGLYFTAYDR